MWWRNVFIALGLLVVGMPAGAQNIDVMEIVNRANYMAYYQGRDGKAQVEMTITDAQGRSRSRRLTILRRDDPPSDTLADNAYRGDQQFYVYFKRPADVARTVFLVRKYLDRDDDRWLYLPALDLVKRIAAADKRTSFVGSDFFYEDVSGRLLEDDVHELIGETDAYYQIRSTPKDPGSVEFATYETFIHKASFLPVQTRYLDAQGQELRVIRVTKVDTVQGRPTVTEAVAEDRRTGSVTVMRYSAVVYDLGLPAELFGERYLRRPPLKQLR